MSPTEPGGLAGTLDRVAEVLDQLEVDWAVGGSLASASYGEPRATNDVDIIVDLDARSARRFTRALGERFYADESSAAEATRRHASFNVLDRESLVKVDVFVPPPGPLGTGQLYRRRSLRLFPHVRPIYVLGPEDTILQKLRWYRMGGEVSDRQWRDVVSILRLLAEPLDDVYLTRTAADGGLAKLLTRARAAAEREASGSVEE